MEKAKERVTAKGNPSGIATTIIDIHKMIISKIFFATIDFGSVRSLSTFPLTLSSINLCGKLNKK